MQRASVRDLIGYFNRGCHGGENPEQQKVLFTDDTKGGRHRNLPRHSHGIEPNTIPAVRRRCSLPEENLQPGVRKVLLVHSKRSPSANIIKKEFRYASLKKVDLKACRRSYVPLVSSNTGRLVFGPDLYKSLLDHSKRSPSANIIKKEYRYASLKTVDRDACRRRSEPLISATKGGFLLDPDVYELLRAHSRRSPSANVIKKEFRYVRLRKTNPARDDDASSISTMYSSYFDDDEPDEHGLYVYDWIIDLEPNMPLPDMFPYYQRSTFSDGGRRMSGSTLQSEEVLSTSSGVSGFGRQ